MNILFIHQNMPGQYKHLARYFGREKGHKAVFITKAKAPQIAGVEKILYAPSRGPSEHTHHYLRMYEDQILHGQAVVRVAMELRQKGFRPDVICAHPGWGEALFIKDVFPTAKLLAFCEFFYRSRGSDVGFDPPGSVPALDTVCRLRVKNAALLTSIEAADWGVSPTTWQRRQHPEEFQHKISVIHEGVDTNVCHPDGNATLTLPTGRTLTRSDEVITYVARNLEPYRGFPTFMRAVAEICRRRPGAEIILVGGDDVSYGGRPQDAANWREKMLAEVSVDPARVHFLGRVPYDTFLKVLQVSSAHVYLTYPFVLSWSMLESMACGCLVIGSDTPPVAEVVKHGSNGLLVDFFSPEDVADKVDAVLDHPDRMAGLREAARSTIVTRYDLDTVCLPAQLKLIEDLHAGRLRHDGQ